MKVFIYKSISDNYREVFFLLFLVVGMVTLQILDKQGLSLFRYQRNEILSGQLWRLISCHFVHFSWKHLVLNIAGLIFIWALFKHILSQRIWLLLTLGSIVGIDISLLIIHPEIKWYMGLSGVLHGYFAGGAILQIRLNGIKSLPYLILLMIKLLWEYLNGPLPGSEELTGVRVITEAHIYGAIGGSIVMLFLIVKRKTWIIKNQQQENCASSPYNKHH